MNEGAPQTHIPYEADDFNDTHQEEGSFSPMEQKLDFNVNIVFDDLANIIPEYNNFIKSRGDSVPEEMIEAQNEALNAMRSIKNDGPRITSKAELIDELDRRVRGIEKDGEIVTLSPEAKELIEGIL
jgi:hypothetical protein